MDLPPVDLSFKDICNVSEALIHVPNSGQRPLEKKGSKYLSRSLRLNNNCISNLDGLQDTLSSLFAEPSKLAWLDLSFNKLTNIASVLCELTELRVLYLHGNSICNLEEADMLGRLSYLHTITLHGNPVDLNPGYRRHVIAVLPHLKKMDFNGVTSDERVMANILHHRSKPAKRSQDKSEF